MNVFDHLKSDADKFEAQLKPVTVESSLMIQTKIELIRNCDSWETIAEAVQSKQENVLAVCLLNTENLAAVSSADAFFSSRPESMNDLNSTAILFEGPVDEILNNQI